MDNIETIDKVEVQRTPEEVRKLMHDYWFSAVGISYAPTEPANQIDIHALEKRRKLSIKNNAVKQPK